MNKTKPIRLMRRDPVFVWLMLPAYFWRMMELHLKHNSIWKAMGFSFYWTLRLLRSTFWL